MNFLKLAAFLLPWLLSSCVSPEKRFQPSTQPDAATLGTANNYLTASSLDEYCKVWVHKIDGKFAMSKGPHKLQPGVRTLYLYMTNQNRESFNELTFDFKPQRQYVLQCRRGDSSIVSELMDVTTSPQKVVHTQSNPIVRVKPFHIAFVP